MLNSNLGDLTYCLSDWLQFYRTCRNHSNIKLIDFLIHVLEISLKLEEYGKRKCKSVTYVDGGKKLSIPKMIG